MLIVLSTEHTYAYFVKEQGRWKFALLPTYLKKVRDDMNFLGEAIKDYYTDNKRLPSSLSQLVSPIAYINSIPPDTFNDKGDSYVYTTVENIYEIYSFGPDGDDDLGIIKYEYDRNKNPISDGDIVRSIIAP
jgi:hypothetical protein